MTGAVGSSTASSTELITASVSAGETVSSVAEVGVSMDSGRSVVSMWLVTVSLDVNKLRSVVVDRSSEAAVTLSCELLLKSI